MISDARKAKPLLNFREEYEFRSKYHQTSTKCFRVHGTLSCLGSFWRTWMFCAHIETQYDHEIFDQIEIKISDNSIHSKREDDKN